MSDYSKRFLGCFLLTASICCVTVPGSIQPGLEPDVFHSAAGYQEPVKPVLLSAGEIAVNFADAEELEELPGIGETIASFILAERETNGPFYYPEDLMAVRGIGKQKMEDIRPMLDLRLNEGGEE